MKNIIIITALLMANHCQAFQARITAYCGQEDKINGRYSCTGERLHKGEVAADLDIYPLGTKLRIDGEEYTVADCGSAIQGSCHFDRYCSSRSEMNEIGTQICNVEVIGHAAFNSKRQHENFTPKHSRQLGICHYSSKRGLIFV